MAKVTHDATDSDLAELREKLLALFPRLCAELPDEELTLDYSPSTDTLYAHVGSDPPPASTLEPFVDDLELELDMEETAIVGFVVFNLRRNVRHSALFSRLFRPFYQQLLRDGVVKLKPTDPTLEHFANDLSSLLSPELCALP
jgi:hypothetical protein